MALYYKLADLYFILTANGIVQGIRPLVGYNYGAGETKRVHRIFQTTLVLCAGVMFIGTVLSWTIPNQLIGLFTTNKETLRIGVTALHRISLGFIISAVSVDLLWCAGRTW